MDYNLIRWEEILQALCMVPFLFIITRFIFKKLKEKHSFFDIKLMNVLFLYHLLFGAAYYVYTLTNASDSKKYYIWPQEIGKEWLNFLGTETTFINFLSYPFINGLGFSYEMMMLLFTWIGFLGFVYAYLFFKENIPLNVKVFKRLDLLTLILFLPNMHFWTASLGKGAPIFFGLMLFAYAISRPEKRWIGLLISSLLVFAIRPHIFLLLAGGAFVGVITGAGCITWKTRLTICSGIIMGLFLLQGPILSVVNLDGSTNLVADFLHFTSSRAASLDDAGSGVDLAQYSLPQKIFTFWFRPLFFDAPGILGIIVSIENLIYILLFIKLFKRNFFKLLKSAPANVKMSLALFLTTSFAMTFVMSNLGIMIRQKTMVMYFLFFVIYYYLAQEKNPAVYLEKKEHDFYLPRAA